MTLLRLSDAAIELFESVGPTATIEAIADRAGVSRRTVFRYIDQKEELAFIHPVLWFDVFDEAIVEFAAEPLDERLRLSSRAIALHIDSDPDRPRRALMLAGQHLELSRGFNGVYQRWIERVAVEVMNGTDGDSATRFRARIIGAAVMGMVDAVMREWVASPASASFTSLHDEGFATLKPLLAMATTKPQK